MKTQIVSKYFDNESQAITYLNKLYLHFDNAKIIQAPLFSENGIYTFKIVDVC